MGYRKIIAFGDTSYVVSLPKDWVEKNGLKKGDVVNVIVDENVLKISSIEHKQDNSQSEININFDGNLKRLNSQILYAYINNYNVINLNGKDIYKILKDIREITKNFMYLDIIDQTSNNRVVLNSSVNLYDVSVHDTIRRMDRILVSMSEDVKNYLSGKEQDVSLSLDNKEENINKLCHLVFKTLKGGFNPSHRSILKLDLHDLFYYWELALFVEKVADQVKRIPRFTDFNVPNQLVMAFDAVMTQYQDAMKSNFVKDYELAVSVIAKKKQVYEKIESCLEGLDPKHIVYKERIRVINDYSGNLAKALLRLKVEK
ncbi:phosphate uptake regulator PhoU [Candidatus Woesearchaeota archaeon]|nr:phosphate uptake regulator PhoU [Candidatus Woesearchaeota archaeon]